VERDNWLAGGWCYVKNQNSPSKRGRSNRIRGGDNNQGRARTNLIAPAQNSVLPGRTSQAGKEGGLCYGSRLGVRLKVVEKKI